MMKMSDSRSQHISTEPAVLHLLSDGPNRDFVTRYRPASSARHALRRHTRRTLEALGLKAKAQGALEPGWQQLFSSYVPGLAAGWHTATVRQDIQAANNNPLSREASQRFNVVSPRFVLPDGAIYSMYPPQGHGDKPEVLPHVVLNDPTLPWERTASWKAESNPPSDYALNRVPWMAVLVFSEEELRLPDAALNGVESIFQDIPTLANGATQSATFTTQMNITDIDLLRDTATPITSEPDDEPQSDVLFLHPALFTSLFTTYDAKGAAQKGQQNFDVSRYRFLAHVRNINVTGMATAAQTTEQGDRAFGVVMSHRTGPVALDKPTTVVVHLLSIDGIEKMTYPIPSSAKYVALSSLKSWTYNCLPPGSFSIYDEFHSLGSSLDVLRLPLPTLELASPEATQVQLRLQDGYMLTSYRVRSGEVTSALTRGPLTPINVPFPLTDAWTGLSNSGTDFQILDRQLGIMDITYSAAWQIGKAMALTDAAFTTALSHVRKQVRDMAVASVKASLLRSKGLYQDRKDLFSSIPESMEALKNCRHFQSFGNPANAGWRWRERPPVSGSMPDLRLSGDDMQERLSDAYDDAAKTVASAVDNNGHPLEEPYDEHNTPYSSDWVTVLKWVLEKLFLFTIPAHYLISDPAILTPESLRFFAIDKNWTQAMLDGALSLANHIDQTQDEVRVAIKKALNWYLGAENSEYKLKHVVPVCGCFLRSTLLTKFPDLRVSIVPDEDPLSPAILLRHDLISADTMLCLFSQPPGGPAFQALRFAQPPHQQTFSAGVDMDSTRLGMVYKRIYSGTFPDDHNHGDPIDTPQWYPDKPDTIRGQAFIWNQVDPESQQPFPVNTLLFDNWPNDLWTTENAEMNKLGAGWFAEPYASAALVGAQLNTPSWQLEVDYVPPAKAVVGLEKDFRFLIPPKRRPRRQPPVKTADTISNREPPRAALRSSFSYGQARRITLGPTDPSPHSRPARDTGEAISIPAGIKLADPETGSRFSYNVWTVESGGSLDKVPPVPTQTGIAQDLIFSILWRSDIQPSAFALQKLTLSIPMGPIDASNPPGVPNLTPAYTGTGAAMLSNLRFNVLPSFSANSSSLLISLVPRSQSGSVMVYLFKDVSFILNQVNINPYQQPVAVNVTIQESYRDRTLVWSTAINLTPSTE